MDMENMIDPIFQIYNVSINNGYVNQHNIKYLQ